MEVMGSGWIGMHLEGRNKNLKDLFGVKKEELWMMPMFLA